MSRQISQSRLRLLRLEGGVKTKSRFLDPQQKLFEIVKIFSTVETYSLPVSRLRLSIKWISGDQIIILTFDLLKTGKIIWSPDQKNFRSPEIWSPDPCSQIQMSNSTAVKNRHRILQGVLHENFMLLLFYLVHV
jgi:hypothetical protein